MTFKLEHHHQILIILNCLDIEVLNQSSAYFGGGTLLTLDFNEYRWSKDIDFISSVSTGGYKYLRTLIFDRGYEALFRDLSRISLGRSSADQYGIRMVIYIDNIRIKTEIIAEVRFQPDPPRYPSWSPVACLSINDCFTSKLLANSDRFMDDSVEARDVIDLAVLRLHYPLLQVAINKAENAYPVMRPLKNAVERFQRNEDYRSNCFSGLKVDKIQIPKIMDGVDLLADDLGLPHTQRIFREQHDIFDF